VTCNDRFSFLLKSHQIGLGGSLHKFVTLIACASFFGAMAGSSLAADLPAPTPPPPPLLPVPGPGLLVTVGMGADVTNSFPGAKTYRVFPLPYFDWRKPGEIESFHAPDDGFGITLLDLWHIKAGPVARYVPERGLSNGNGNFAGLATIGWTVEVGGFIEYWPTDFLRSRFELRQGINGSRGLDANIELDAVGRYGPWTLSLGPRAAFGDDRFMQAYFSVTPSQAAANGRVTPYSASGGLTSLGAIGSAKYAVTPAWSVTGFAGYNRLVASAAASPITNNLGSKNEFMGGAIIEYTFTFGGF
jgi:MipA family protein